MIDLHCHILPGIDDGSPDIETSIKMANVAVADGIKTIAATPHFFDGYYSNPADEISGHVKSLNNYLAEKGIEINIIPGSEAHICTNMPERVLKGEISTINNKGKYILIEFPVQTIPPGAKEELFKLKLKGLIPIIAHPERIAPFRKNIDILYDFVQMGCLLQVTAMSITGGMGKSAMNMSHKLIDLRLAHIIASDAHSPVNRPPILSKAVDAAAIITGSTKEAESMVTTTPAAVINGEEINLPEPREQKKKKWWFF